LNIRPPQPVYDSQLGLCHPASGGRSLGDESVNKDGVVVLVAVLAYNLEISNSRFAVCLLDSVSCLRRPRVSDTTTVKLKPLISRVSIQVDILAALRLKFVLSEARMNAGLSK